MRDLKGEKKHHDTVLLSFNFTAGVNIVDVTSVLLTEGDPVPSLSVPDE